MVEVQRGGQESRDDRADLLRIWMHLYAESITFVWEFKCLVYWLFARVGARLPPEVQNASLELQTRWKSYLKRESVWEVVALKACVCKQESAGFWRGVRLITADFRRNERGCRCLPLFFLWFFLTPTHAKRNSFSRAASFWVSSALITACTLNLTETTFIGLLWSIFELNECPRLLPAVLLSHL